MSCNGSIKVFFPECLAYRGGLHSVEPQRAWKCFANERFDRDLQLYNSAAAMRGTDRADLTSGDREAKAGSAELTLLEVGR